MPNDKGLGEQALSQAAEAGFSSQLDDVEELDVDIQTNPLKAVQGKADSVSMKGKKMVQGDFVQYSEGKDLSPEITRTLRNTISDLLELRDFVLEGMSLRLTQLEVQKGRMMLQSQSHVESLPSS
jgi:hypothetical protein